jgi:hypothetical protein
MSDGAAYHRLNGLPFPDGLCMCCGDDPQNIRNGHYIVGRESDKYKIDRRGNICLNCAFEAALHLERAYPHFIVWPKGNAK